MIVITMLASWEVEHVLGSGYFLVYDVDHVLNWQSYNQSKPNKELKTTKKLLI